MRATKQAKKAAHRGKASRRPQIVAAAEKLISTRGLAHTTTKAIAAEAGCSEGALYVHFNGRSELLLAVLEEGLPDMLVPLRALEQAAGKATPQKNLQRALLAIFAYHQRVIPGICALFSEPDLLADFGKSLASQNKGPHGAIARLRKYIAAEQKLGRVSRAVDAEFAATTLMANSFFRSFVGQLMGTKEPFEPFCRRMVAKVLGI